MLTQILRPGCADRGITALGQWLAGHAIVPLCALHTAESRSRGRAKMQLLVANKAGNRSTPNLQVDGSDTEFRLLINLMFYFSARLLSVR